MKDQLEALEPHLAALEESYVLMGFERKPGAFRVWWGAGDETTAMDLEAGAHQLLRAIAGAEADRDDDCRTCPACTARLARVRAALAALEEGGLIASPTPEAVRH
ncbi:MAG: hypothetical protein ACK4FB_08880 [Brevundimonas sp.]|uniref:hypothetical protein n=1 Tax=Brevundimonas sp. TaxID=1871086 RepID=UPI0039187364